MSTPRTTNSLFLLAFTVSAPGCLVPGGDTATFSNPAALSPKRKAELKMQSLRWTAQISMWNRVSVPVKAMAPWVSLLQEIESGSEIVPDQRLTAREPEELRDRQGWEGNPQLEDVVIEKLGFERMRFRDDFDMSVVGDGLRDGPLGGCEGKARVVDSLDEHPGRPMCVFEPTLYFDDSDGGYISVDLTLQWRFQNDSRGRDSGRNPGWLRRLQQCTVRVIIRGASIPVDVFYDDQIDGVTVNPERRKDKFRIGKCEVDVRTLGPIRLPRDLRRLFRKIIDRRFGDEVTAGVQEAVSSFSLGR